MTTERKSLPGGASQTGKKAGLGSFVSGLVGEFKKVVWPSRKDIVRLTTIIIILTAVLGIILGAIDFGFKSLISFLSGVGS